MPNEKDSRPQSRQSSWTGPELLRRLEMVGWGTNDVARLCGRSRGTIINMINGSAPIPAWMQLIVEELIEKRPAEMLAREEVRPPIRASSGVQRAAIRLQAQRVALRMAAKERLAFNREIDRRRSAENAK